MRFGSVSENRRVAFSDFSIHGFLGVAVNPGFLFIWDIRIRKDSVNRTFWNAGATVNAFIWVDDEIGFSFAESFNRANGNAFLILVVNASRCNNVGHVNSSNCP